jgi:hypothetical protein
MEKKPSGGHMKERRQLIPLGGLLITVATAGYIVAQLHGQTPPTGDFTNAATAQVRDAQGQIVLQGQFMAPVEEDGDLERRATLAPTGVDNDAAGEAEIEFAKTAPTEQEVEFSVEKVQAGATFTFVIDGTDIATVTANRNGRAEVELKVKIPGRE